jgi:ribokinase
VSGVGVNVAKAVTALGGKVTLLSLLGKDLNGKSALAGLSQSGLNCSYILPQLKSTPASVILYDQAGQRQINVDLKDIQESSYPEELFNKALSECSLAVLCNINFSRPFLVKARKANKIVATDVHVIADIFDEYNQDFMKYANILFMSDEGIQGKPADFARKVAAKYDNDIIVIGLGAKGALLYVKQDNYMGEFPAVTTRKITSTIGAGDALFSSFIYYYAKTNNPYLALKKAIVFASYKIGEKGAADGFLSEAALDELYDTLNK